MPERSFAGIIGRAGIPNLQKFHMEEAGTTGTLPNQQPGVIASECEAIQLMFYNLLNQGVYFCLL